MYNKTAQTKFKAIHPDEYIEMTRKASLEYRWKNIEQVREKDRLRKSPFMMEWNSFRRIDVF
jgi:hypothetical protein